MTLKARPRHLELGSRELPRIFEENIVIKGVRGVNILFNGQQTEVTFVTSCAGVYRMSSLDAGSFRPSAVSVAGAAATRGPGVPENRRRSGRWVLRCG